MTRLPLHPLCEMFPRINGSDMDDLRDDIAKRGLDQAIVLYEGAILDGRHRYDACLELDVKPIFVEYHGDDPLGFVMAANVKRRHMTPGQQGQMAAMATMSGRDKLVPPGGDRDKLVPPITVKAAAKAAGVGETTVKMARRVAKADPGLAKEVVNGTVTLPEAVEQVSGKRPGKHAKSPDQAALASELDQVREERDQLADDNRQLLAENESMSKIIDADGDLSAAHKIIKSLQEQVKKLEARIAGLQREKNAAISAAKSAQRKVSKK